MACGAGAQSVAEENEPQGTEIRRRAQELFQVVPRVVPVFSPRDFWKAARDACPAFNNIRQHDAGEFLVSLRRELTRLPGNNEVSLA